MVLTRGTIVRLPELSPGAYGKVKGHFPPYVKVRVLWSGPERDAVFRESEVEPVEVPPVPQLDGVDREGKDDG